jgi:hypothetical protein
MFLVPLVIALGSPCSPPDREDGAGADLIHARYEVDLLGKGRAVFALPAGRRAIQGFRWIPAPDSPGSWRSARIRLVWDGDDPGRAGIDLPLGHFVLPEPDEQGDGEANAPVLINRRAMPYRSGGRLVIDADGPIRGSFRVDSGPIGTDFEPRGYLRSEVVPTGERSGPDPQIEIEGDDAGVPAPPVRYWYDRRPAPDPAPDADRG